MTIEEIGAEMSTQDNRATQYPMFIVVEDVDRPVPSELSDGRHRVSEPDYGSLCENCIREMDEDGFLDNEDCDECADDCFWWYKREQEPNLMAGVFFTAKACEDHIRANSYHYNNPKSYGISAWRNPEMEEVMKHLISSAGKEVPSHYR